MSQGMRDLAIVLVSYNAADWLRPCLDSVFAHAGQCSLDVVVVDNSGDGSAELVEREFPEVRTLRCENRGYAHGSNRGVMTCDARYVLFLNPDTEILEGTLERLVGALDERRTVGLAGVRQVGPDGMVLPTIRRFPSAIRSFAEALGSERFPFRGTWLGERELDLAAYERERECDWTSGSFMVVRREALESAGLLDERFFFYSEEPDLCLRLRRAGWEVRHLPVMTILHHAGKAGANPALAAQDAFARLQYARKHFSALHRAAYAGALGFGYALRAVAPGRARAERRHAARSSLRVLVGLDGPPFRRPPAQAVALRDRDEAR